ncbi:hypothetical protein FSP39_012079 [Pinctada imbricata]|uniref:ETS domain-containing protein n=1 Tax=Pinctada imbricata TaxID=66713 RepID=A0AA88YCJ7_PINIB|nr:hypothetical protein FSP39_012079 [Pinctada imbricata]
MNGKALCLLRRSDFMERAPKNGDILYNALQKLAQKTTGGLLCSPLPSFPSTLIPPVSVTCGYPQQPQLTQGESPSQNGLLLLAPSSSALTTPICSTKPRPFVPILPQPVGLGPKTEGCVSSIPGVLSPAPSASDPESLSDNEENSSQTDQNHGSDMRLSYMGNVNGSDSMSYPRIKQDSDCRLLWEFIHQLLQNPCYKDYVCWEKQDEYVFRINNPMGLAQLWGHQKNRSNMTYEKLSRALRYYYRMNIIKKVSGKRLTYKFMQPPSNIQKGQRGAKPHSKSCLSTSISNLKQEVTESSVASNGDRPVERAISYPINTPSIHRPLPLLPTLDRSPIKSEVPNFCDFSSPNNEVFRLSPSMSKEFPKSPAEELVTSPFPPNLINAHTNALSVKREPGMDEAHDFTMTTLKRKERLSQESDQGHSTSSSPVQNNESRLPLLLNFIQDRSPSS